MKKISTRDIRRAFEGGAFPGYDKFQIAFEPNKGFILFGKPQDSEIFKELVVVKSRKKLRKLMGDRDE